MSWPYLEARKHRYLSQVPEFSRIDTWTLRVFRNQVPDTCGVRVSRVFPRVPDSSTQVIPDTREQPYRWRRVHRPVWHLPGFSKLETAWGRAGRNPDIAALFLTLLWALVYRSTLQLRRIGMVNTSPTTPYHALARLQPTRERTGVVSIWLCSRKTVFER